MVEQRVSFLPNLSGFELFAETKDFQMSRHAVFRMTIVASGNSRYQFDLIYSIHLPNQA